MKSFRLKLNSYKADTSIIQKEISQLKDAKLELQSTIISRQQQNNQLKVEVERLRHENHMLHMRVQQLKSDKQNHNIKTKQNRKITELQKIIKNQQKNLQQCLASAKNSIQLYNQQLQINYRLKQQFAEQKYQLIKQIQSLHRIIDRFEQQTQQANVQNSRNSLKHNPNRMEDYQSQVQLSKYSQKHENIQIPCLAVSQRQNKQGKQTERQRYKTSPVSQDLTVQEVYMKLMRKLFFKIKNKGLSAKQVTGLPQVRTLKNLEIVSENNLVKLFGSYPFQINQKDQIYNSFRSIQKQLTRKYKSLSGVNFYQFILSRLQQCEIADLLASDIEVSNMQSQNMVNDYQSSHSNEDQTSLMNKRQNNSHNRVISRKQLEDQRYSTKRRNQNSQHQFNQHNYSPRNSQRSRTSAQQQSQSSAGYGGQFVTLQNYPDPVYQGNFKKNRSPVKRYSIQQRQ